MYVMHIRNFYGSIPSRGFLEVLTNFYCEFLKSAVFCQNSCQYEKKSSLLLEKLQWLSNFTDQKSGEVDVN